MSRPRPADHGLRRQGRGSAGAQPAAICLRLRVSLMRCGGFISNIESLKAWIAERIAR
jgi:hypothetical protein